MRLDFVVVMVILVCEYIIGLLIGWIFLLLLGLISGNCVGFIFVILYNYCGLVIYGNCIMLIILVLYFV